MKICSLRLLPLMKWNIFKSVSNVFPFNECLGPPQLVVGNVQQKAVLPKRGIFQTKIEYEGDSNDLFKIALLAGNFEV